MNREAMLNHPRDRRAEIGERFAVDRLGLFGSAACDGPSFAADTGLKRHLEKLVGRRVDLVTESGLKPRVRPSVARDLIRVP